MLRQAWFEFVRGQRQCTGVRGRPGPEPAVVSYLVCVSVVVVNRCAEHLSKPRPAQMLFFGHFGNKLVNSRRSTRPMANLRFQIKLQPAFLGSNTFTGELPPLKDCKERERV